MANSPDELRAVRSELELLRRVADAAARRARAECAVRSQRFSEGDRRELQGILRDARHPLVERMIEQIDAAFPDIREDIPMAAVRKEADQVAREIEESGVLDEVKDSPDEGTSPASAPPGDPAVDGASNDRSAADGPNADTLVGGGRNVMSALDQAAADMAALVGEFGGEDTTSEPQDSACTGGPQDSSSEAADAAMADHEPIASEADPVAEVVSESTPGLKETNEFSNTHNHAPFAMVEASPQADEDSLPQTADAGGPMTTTHADDFETQVEEAANVDAAFARSQPEGQSQGHAEVATDDTNEIATFTEATPGESRQAVAPDSGRLLGAVDQVEAGVQRIARLISDEVREQSLQVASLAADMARRQADFEHALGEAERIVSELKSLREQSLAAREDVEDSQREASLLREAARAAKERAERAADTAESAAEQSVLDAAAARNCTATAP